MAVMTFIMKKIVGVLVLVVVGAHAEYARDGGFMPSYRTEDQLAEPSARVDNGREDRDNQNERTQRFGVSAYGGSGQGEARDSARGQPRDQLDKTQRFGIGISDYGGGGLEGGYGSTAPGLYGPVKIDLGGVLIGSILGFGAVVILPKIISALSYSYGGGYGRSLETDFSQVSDWMHKLDETLNRYNIDSASCMQRLTCSYVQLANENVISGNATDFDATLSSLSSNSLVRRMISGTSVYEAVSAGGVADTDCQVLYPKCKLDKKTVVKVLSQLFKTALLTLLEKLFWLVTVVVSVVLCGYLITNVYNKWTNSPVIVTFSEKLISVHNLPFPSVTICPQIKSKASSYYFSDRLHNYQKKRNTNEIQREFLKDISIICNEVIESDRNFTDASLVVNLRKVAPNLYNMFDSCFWLNTRIHRCHDLFKEVWTAEGLCFNMNGIAASEMFRNTVQSAYQYSKRTNQSRGWSLEGGYSNSEKNPYPWRGNKNHANPDLEIYLRSKHIDTDPKCNGLKTGYAIYLHHPADFPQTSLYHYSAVNDQVTSLAVSVHHEISSEQLRKYPPDVRQCYFLEDRTLLYFRNYTTKNCEAECLSNYTYEHCGCVGFYMPHNHSNKLCAENKVQCMRHAYDKMVQRELNLVKESDGCSCRPTCHSVEYDAEMLKTSFKVENYKGRKRSYLRMGLMPIDITYNISKVEIFFKKHLFITTTRSELFGTTDFLANIGGLLGVFMGFSFLSLVEVFYFLTLRLGMSLRRDLKEERKNIKKNRSARLDKSKF